MYDTFIGNPIKEVGKKRFLRKGVPAAVHRDPGTARLERK